MMRRLEAGELEPIFRVAESFDAFRDNPWFCLFRELDTRFPGSRFILTLRDELRWMDSVVNHFGRTDSDFRRWIYGVGSPIGNERVFLDRYCRHNREVRAYFEDRPDDLLVLPIEQGAGWPELCEFLDAPTPEQAFPYSNRRIHRRGIRGIIRRRLTRHRLRGEGDPKT